MKESEAKEKWCPLTVFANYTTDRNEIGERYPEGTKAVISSRCIGSACMMWEDWTPPPIWLDRKGSPQRNYVDATPPDGWKAVKIEGEKDWVEWHRVSDEPCGDCGLKAKEPGCFYPG